MLRIRTIMTICTVLAVSTGVAYADSYVSLTQGVPGFAEAAEKASSGDFSGFINNLYNMSIGLASVIAVFVIIYAGVRISTSDNAGIISELRSRVGMALGGLVLLLGAYVLLNYINPDLVSFRIANMGKIGYTGVTRYKPTEVRMTDGVSFASGKSGAEMREDIEAPTEERFKELLGFTPQSHRVDSDGRIRLTPQEIRQILDQSTAGGNATMSLGEKINIGQGGCDKENKNARFTVSKEGQIAVAAASHICPGVPSSWVDSTSLYKIMACESSGIVGNINYQMRPYLRHYGISQNQIATDIRSNQFYSRHCCSLKNSRKSDIRNRVLSEPGGAQCNPATESKLIQMRGNCYSAAGFGQLLVVNMKRYQPSGVAGFGNAAEEMCGMFSYIKDRYGSPERAWSLYNTDRNGDGKVDEGY